MEKTSAAGLDAIASELEKMTETAVCERDEVFGNTGRLVAYPQTEREVSEVLSLAAHTGITVIPEGGGTKRGYGGTLEAADVLLSMKKIRGIVEHEAGDLILTVKAGTPLADIQHALAEKGQFLPLDASDSEKGTIGGILAANMSGPKRLRYGSGRDLVVGMRVVHAGGQVMRAGAKVVKNVAGYDMNKLYVGSMGTLGIVTEVTLKCRPLPERESVVLLESEAGVDPLAVFSRHLLDSPMEPVAVEIVNPALSDRMGGRRAFSLALSFEDVPASVERQEQWVRRNAQLLTVSDTLRNEEAVAWWKHFLQTDRQFVTLKVGSLLTDVPVVLHHAERLSEQLGITLFSHGSAGVGLSKLHVQAEKEAVCTFIRGMRQFMSGREGYVTVEHAPLSVRRQVGVWGEGSPNSRLFAGIKRAFDPKGILNPGRFVVG